MDDANLVEKLDLKHSCFGKALLLEWRNGKTLCPFNTDRFIGDRISAKKQRFKKR
jgi:hypothetical protein